MGVVALGSSARGVIDSGQVDVLVGDAVAGPGVAPLTIIAALGIGYQAVDVLQRAPIDVVTVRIQRSGVGPLRGWY